jgi:hypothetical protein
MDTDPPMTLDYIFFKGEGVTVVGCERMGGDADEKDKTIYGSDHFSMVAEF